MCTTNVHVNAYPFLYKDFNSYGQNLVTGFVYPAIIVIGKKFLVGFIYPAITRKCEQISNCPG